MTKSSEARSRDEHLPACQELVGRLSETLPVSVDAADISAIAKLPFKVESWRAAMRWRSEELARSACDLYERGDVGAAIILTRALVETAATVWHVSDRIDRYTHKQGDQANLGNLDGLFYGWKGDPLDDCPPPANVLTAIDKLDKACPGFRSQYDQLCEVTHPNWCGVLGLYARHDPKPPSYHFDKPDHIRDEPTAIGLVNLRASLEVIIAAYNGLADVMPAFVKSCEAETDTA